MSISRYSAERIHRLDQRERPKPGNKAILLDEKQLFGHNISFVTFDSQESFWSTCARLVLWKDTPGIFLVLFSHCTIGKINGFLYRENQLGQG